MERAVNRLFCLLLGGILLAILVSSVIHWEYNGPAALAAGLALTGGMGALLHFAAPAAGRLSPGRFRIFLGLGLLVYGLVLAILGTLLAQVLIMDMDYVYRSLPEFLEGFPLGQSNFYYIICNNNLGLALLLAAVYRVTGISPEGAAGLETGILFNCLMIWLTVLLLCRCARLLTQSNGAVLGVFLISAFFLPFWLWTPIFYSDTLSMPFILLAVVCFFRFRLSGRWGGFWLAASALAAFLGYAVKGSAAVVVPAVMIWLALEHLDGLKAALRQAVLYLVCFLVLVGGYKAAQHLWILDYTDSEEYALPTELWLCYGSHDDGDYSQEDYDYCASLPDLESRRKAMRQRLWENYSSYTPGELAAFELHKATLTWGDGTYGFTEYLAAPQKANWTAFFTIQGQPGYMPLVYYCQAYQYMLLLLTAAGALVNLAHPWPSGRSFSGLCLLGILFLLSLWETKARYALHFSPLLLLCAACALWQVACPADSGGAFASFEDS